MACLLVPAAEAAIVTAVTKVTEVREKKLKGAEAEHAAVSVEEEVRIPFKRKVKWLTNLLWGGSALLAFEHMWHGEITPWFPFLTAARDAEATAAMLHEMATVGVAMSLFVTVVWIGMVAVTGVIEKRALEMKTEDAAEMKTEEMA